jgi:hypothetical protein
MILQKKYGRSFEDGFTIYTHPIFTFVDGLKLKSISVTPIKNEWC